MKCGLQPGWEWGIVVLTLLLKLETAISSPEEPTDSDYQTFFQELSVPQLSIRIDAKNLNSLRIDPRKYVPATIYEGEKAYTNVAVHLKGGAGSFQPVDRKPAITINMDKFQKDQNFHGMDKWHLNNSVQDPSYLNELICSELFRLANVPCPRVTLAVVNLNDRSLGLYVLKEGFDKAFLKRHFKNANGNLYDAGFVNDITQHLEKDSGDGPNDWSDLGNLITALEKSDLDERWKALENVLDIEKFISFAAMEIMAWHWDGYCMNRNNYRLYHDPISGKFVFLPHGMDQMFWKTDGAMFPFMKGIAAQKVLELPKARELYLSRLESLNAMVDQQSILARLQEIQERIQGKLSVIEARLAQDQWAHAKVVMERVGGRFEFLKTITKNGK